jgi:hypothetical protein
MKRKFTPLVLLTVTLISSVVATSPASAVTYGDPVEAPQIEFPEVVPVWVGGKSLCSGTLVTQQVVLTAAHCVYGQSGPFQISVGGSTLKNGRLIDVDATWYHPRYDAAFSQNDIALLHIKTPAGVSRLGSLPKANMKSLGRKFLIVGWGSDQNGLVTGKLNKLSLINQTVASRKFFKGLFNPKTMIGAGRFFADEILYGGGCTGDSGGPLYQGAAGANRVILGLTSFGAKSCTLYKPTVFTRVDFYISDINNGIALLNSRSVNSPIATGTAAPVGVGPTTTTAPPLPLTVTCKKEDPSAWERRGGFFVSCSANLFSSSSGTISANSVSITKVCISVDGLAPYIYSSDYYYKGVMFDYLNNFPYSAGAGCYKFQRNGVDIISTGNGVGPHTATITFTDSLGRIASHSFSFYGYY